MGTVSIAYKYVAIAMMLMEINFCAKRLHLPIEIPLRTDTIRVAAAYDPRIAGFMGRIETINFFFSFAESGKLCYIIQLDERHSLSINEYHQKMSKLRSKLDTNGAYQLATNWLTALDVDCARLEKDAPHRVEQEFFYSHVVGTNGSDPVPLPLFSVTWGDALVPKVSVRLSGVTGELISLRQDDESYSKRPSVLIKDQDQLLAISDAEFRAFSPQQRSNLVSRFSAVEYPSGVARQGVTNQPTLLENIRNPHLSRVQKFHLHPPAKQTVQEAIENCRIFCRNVGIPMSQSKLSDVDWGETWVRPDPEYLRTTNDILRAGFTDGSIMESLDGTVFGYTAPDACYVGYWGLRATNEWNPFIGEIRKRWEDLAKNLETVVLPRLGIPSAAITGIQARPARKPPEIGSRGIARVDLCWRNWLNVKNQEHWTANDCPVDAEFDLQSGALKSLRIYDLKLIRSLRNGEATH